MLQPLSLSGPGLHPSGDGRWNSLFGIEGFEMPDQARTGYGALLQKSDGASPPNWITLLGVKSISGPDVSRETHDTTQMDGASQFRTFIGGLVDAGEISFEANWLPREASQGQTADGWMGEFDRSSCDTLAQWRIVTPSCPGEDTVTINVDAIVTGSSFEIPMDDLMQFTGTMKVSGRPEMLIETPAT